MTAVRVFVLIAIAVVSAPSYAQNACATLPTLVGSLILVPCGNGVCDRDGALLQRFSDPVREILPGPAPGAVAIQTGSSLNLWLGEALTPLLELASDGVQVRAVSTSAIALAQPLQNGSTSISILESHRKQVPVLEVKSPILDFACAPAYACILLIQTGGTEPHLVRFAMKRATDLGALSSARRVFISTDGETVQVWDGHQVLESKTRAVKWHPVAAPLLQGCPIFDPDTGLSHVPVVH